MHQAEPKHDRVTRQWFEVMPKGWGTFGDKGMHTGERQMLIERVDDDEDVLAIVGGTFRQDTDRLHKHNGIAVATSERVIFLDKGVFGSEEVMEIGYRQIESITYSSGLLHGGIEIRGLGTASYRIEDIRPKESNKVFADCVRQRINYFMRQDSATQPVDEKSDASTVDELQKLASLLQDGHLTAEEFAVLKQEVIQKGLVSNPAPASGQVGPETGGQTVRPLSRGDSSVGDDQNETTPPGASGGRPPQGPAPQQPGDKKETKPLEILGGCLILVIAAILIGGVCMVVFADSDEDAVEPQPTRLPTQNFAYTPSPLQTSVYIPPPAPTRAPTPIPTHTPSTTGLGVSRSALISVYDSLDVGFEFDSAPLDDGTTRYMGLTEEYAIVVELIGPSRNLTKVAVLAPISSDPSRNVVNGAVMLSLLTHVAEWHDGAEWLTDSLGTIDMTGTATTTYRGYRIRLEYYDIGALYMDITR